MLTTYPQALLLLSWFAFSLSVIACILAYRRTDIAPFRKHIGELQLRLNLLEAESSQLQAAWKRTNSRIAMQQARERSRSGEELDGLPDPQKDPEGWRAAVRSKFLVRK
jgi:hypothetical protein